MSILVSIYLLFAGFALPWYIYQCFCLRNDVSLLKKALLAKLNSTSGLAKTIIKLKDEITQLKHIEDTKIRQISEEWSKYRKFLMEKYPAEDGKEWEFECEYHQKIDGLLK